VPVVKQIDGTKNTPNFAVLGEATIKEKRSIGF